MRLPLLMTASVDTRGMKGADFSAESREGMYVETLRFYEREVLSADGSRIVFAENSGWDISRIAERSGLAGDGRVEFVSLDPDGFDTGRGKGWNEFRLITQAAERSAAIRDSGAFLKVTGRYPVYNIGHFISRMSEQVLDGGKVFCGDMKDHGLYELLHLGWPGRIATSVLFAASLDEWRNVIAKMGEKLDDEAGYWSEHLLYDYMKRKLASNPGSVCCRFDRELDCGGMQGTSRRGGMFFSKRNNSLRAKANRLLGNVIRRCFPWFWF